MAYVELKGIRFWYDEQGSGEPLLLLHPGGAGVDSRAFGANLDGFTKKFRVFLMDRRAHGYTPDTEGEITFEQMADDTINFIEEVIGKPAKLVGYSDGGVVALLVAQKRPDLVERLVSVASVFHRDGWDGGVLKPGEEPPQFLADSYAQVSPDGKEHYEAVVKKLDDMHYKGPLLTTDDLKKIQTRTLVMVGDDDGVHLEHAIVFYRALPSGELAVVPGTSHGLMPEKPDLCNKIIIDFLTLDPIKTFAPIRRA
ncbi:MAG TPA: alpha/beta hydrolase [Candidatus Paceibacterota bacterium]|nr:alpha/beta hydrolase [Candidatus Paceibacterota bacterium]